MLKQTEFDTNFISEGFRDLIEKECGVQIEDNFNLSNSQKKAFELFKQGKNIFIIGPGGCGKSFLIKHFENYVKNLRIIYKKIVITSTTGISAYNIGGMTIHSFMGIGTGELELDKLLKKVMYNKYSRDRIINVDILVIDEISMLSADLFEKLNIICQRVRKNKLFFGGIQIVFTGDLLQLLPVFSKNSEIYKNIDERLIIESLIFNNEFNKKKGNIIELTENFRQKGDTHFINLLLRIRNGTFTKDDISVINSRLVHKYPNIDTSKMIHLVSANKNAQSINEEQIYNIEKDTFNFKAFYNTSDKNKTIEDILLKELQSQFKQKGIDNLSLKQGARVMLIKNLDTEIGLVNGALGTIDSINKDFVIVKFDNNYEKQIISRVSWDLEMDDCIVSANQIPLMLAYSLTIHRCQSLSLDNAILDLAMCFCDHQIYVALSRLRSLDGLYIKSFNPSKIKINDKMKDFLASSI